MSETSKKVCLVRFHDGTAKPNWGGRGTSLGLIRCINRGNCYRVTDTINGHVIVKNWDRNQLVGRIRRRIRRSVAARGFLADPVGFCGIEKAAAFLLCGRGLAPDVGDAVDRIRSADVVFMNGEGDFILGDRETLWRTLVLMRAAQALGKEVWLVNSILSEPSRGGLNQSAVVATEKVLSGCNGVFYRDPESLEIHKSLFPGIVAQWCPDALFSWSHESARFQSGGDWFGPDTEGVDPEVQGYLAEKERIIGILGSSFRLSGSEGEKAQEEFTTVLGGILRNGMSPLIVETDKKDVWLSRNAKKIGIPSIKAEVPLNTGMRVLARMDCIVTGRYHPTILASMVGTPAVILESNSHKNRSLQRVLGKRDEELPVFGRGLNPEMLVARIAAIADTPREDLISKCRVLDEKIDYYGGRPTISNLENGQ